MPATIPAASPAPLKSSAVKRAEQRNRTRPKNGIEAANNLVSVLHEVKDALLARTPSPPPPSGSTTQPPATPSRPRTLYNAIRNDTLITPNRRVKLLCLFDRTEKLADTYQLLLNDDEMREIWIRHQLEGVEATGY